jgi:hypothetical protein
LVLVLAASPASAATRFALVVGSNIGDVSDGVLRWAEEDARRVHAVLTELGGVTSERAILLLAPDAQEVVLALARLRGQIEEAGHQGYRAELFLYYSGHGDADALHLGPARLALARLGEHLRQIPADATVSIIDACRSGTSRNKGASRGPAFDISLARERGPRGFVQLRSASDLEVAQESDTIEGSYFTHYLLGGLRGAADADADGTVTLDELYRYAYTRTLASSHGANAAVQHPEMSVTLAGEGALAVTILDRATARLVLPRGAGGDFLIVDDRTGRIVAELRKPAGSRQVVALPAGRFRVQVRRDGGIFAAELPIEWGGTRVLETSALVAQPVVAALRKGSSLDPAPWSVAVAASAARSALLEDGLALGGRLALERRLLRETVFARVTLGVTTAAQSNPVWSYRHEEIAATAGLGVARFVGPLRVALFADAGVTAIVETAERREGVRLPGVPTRSSGARAGPHLAAEMSLQLPVGGSWAAGLGASYGVTWIEASGEWLSPRGLQGFAGVAYAF